KSMLPKLEALLGDAKLTAAQKGRIVDILAASDDPATGRRFVLMLKSDLSPEVKLRVVENLKSFLPTKWSAVGSSATVKDVATHLFQVKKDDATFLALVAAAQRTDAVTRLSEMVIDETRPVETKREAIRTLGAVHSRES